MIGSESPRKPTPPMVPSATPGTRFCAGLKAGTDPPAQLTRRLTEVRKSGRRALVGKRPMSRVARAVEKGESQGFMKIVVDADTREILGAAILGVGGDEAVHCILDIMYAKAPYTVIQRAVHIHPTVSELIPTMLGELQPLAN